jgi:tRNA threonylcarbamoyladenosine biosynthesis protein TsaB
VIVLGFDTATPSTVVGLRLADGSVLQARDDPDGERRPGHATRLLAMADGLLGDAGLDWPQIARIAVGVGPGTFTGLRIGVATARALVQALDVELVGVSSLRALWWGARAASLELAEMEPVGVLPVIDARRGEVFAALYDGESESIAPHALAPEGVGELLERAEARTGLRRWLAVGDGAVRYREQLERAGTVVPEEDSRLHRIQADAVCSLGASEDAVADGTGLIPDYRRRPDAEMTLEGVV